MAVKKRNLNIVVSIDGTPTKFTVSPSGETFQGYQKYTVSHENGSVIHRYQTDATTKNEIKSYLEYVLPNLRNTLLHFSSF